MSSTLSFRRLVHKDTVPDLWEGQPPPPPPAISGPLLNTTYLSVSFLEHYLSFFNGFTVGPSGAGALCTGLESAG